MIIKRTIKAYASIGSHGWIFAFDNGPYPNMMHIYDKLRKGLVPVTIIYELDSEVYDLEEVKDE